MDRPFATLIMTRPKDANAAFLDEVQSRFPAGVEVVLSPLLEIVSVGNAVDLLGMKGVVFTSKNGVEFAGTSADLPAFCVGAATTQAALAAGWQAVHMADTSDGLCTSLTQRPPDGPLLHIGGVHRRGQVAQRLTRAGISTSEIDVYDQRLLPLSPPARTALQREIPAIVPLFSPRTARQFAQQAQPVAPLILVAISDKVMAETQGLQTFSASVAPIPDADHMAELLVNILRRVETSGLPH